MFGKKMAAIAVVTTGLSLAVGMTAAQATTGTLLLKGWSDVNAIACPTSATCIAVGTNSAGTGDKAAVVHVAKGTFKLWTGTLKSTAPLYSVSCASKTLCLGVGTNELASVKVSTGEIAKLKLKLPKTGILALDTISCNSKYCLAGGFEGSPEAGEAVLLKLSPAGKVLSTTLDKNGTGIGSISCENTRTCMAAIADGGTKPEHFDPIVNGKIKSGAALPAETYVEYVACHGTKSCDAIGGSISGSGESTDLYWPLSPSTGKLGKVLSLGTFSGSAMACPAKAGCDIAGYSTGTTPTPEVTEITGRTAKVNGYSYLTEPFDNIACAPATRYCFAVGPDSSGATVRSEITKF